MLATDARAVGIGESALRRRVRSRKAREIRNRARRRIIRWNARWFSGALLVGGIVLLAFFSLWPGFYIHTIALEGVSYYSDEEMLGLLEVARRHIFWVDPFATRARLLRQPGIMQAEIQLGWPVGVLQVRVQERPARFAWQAGERVFWIAEDGRVMPQYHRNAGLPVVRALVDEDIAPERQSRISPALVADVLWLLARIPPGDELLYDSHPLRGLGRWRSDDSIIWYGHGGDLSRRYALAEIIEAETKIDGLRLSEINVSRPEAPHYRAQAAEDQG